MHLRRDVKHDLMAVLTENVSFHSRNLINSALDPTRLDPTRDLSALPGFSNDVY